MSNTSRVYVGTYAKYNAGSIKGAWLDLSDYADHDEFIAACLELHKDETDPELMFQDFEGFPRSYYGESYIEPELWDWLELTEDEQNIVAAYKQNWLNGTIEEALEAYQGTADTKEDFAENYWNDTGMWDGVPEFARGYIDFERVARDMELGGDFVFERYEGELYVFRSN